MTSKILRRMHMYLALFLTPWVLMYGLSTMAFNHHHALRSLYGGAPPFAMERELDYGRRFPDSAGTKEIARQILVDLDLDGRFRVRGESDRRLTILRQDPESRAESSTCRGNSVSPSRHRNSAPRICWPACMCAGAEGRLRATAAAVLADNGLGGLFRVRRPNPQRLIITRFDFWPQTRLTYHIAEGRLVAEDQQLRLDNFLIHMHFRAGFAQESFLSDLWAVVVDLVCVAFVLWVATGLYMWWQLAHARRWGAIALGSGWLSFILFVLGL